MLKAKILALEGLRWLTSVAVALTLNFLLAAFYATGSVFQIFKVFHKEIKIAAKFLTQLLIRKKPWIDKILEPFLIFFVMVLFSLVFISNLLKIIPIRGSLKGLTVVFLFFLMFYGWHYGIPSILKILKSFKKPRILNWSKTYVTILLFAISVCAFRLSQPLQTIACVGETIKPEITEIRISKSETLKHQIWARYSKNLNSYKKAFTKAQLIPIERSADWATKRIFWNSHQLIKPIMIGKALKESSFRIKIRSSDGGKGPWMITRPDKKVLLEAKRILGHEPNLMSAKDNCLCACIILRNNLKIFKGNLHLAMLAFNIGPNNTDLKQIIENYVGKPVEKIDITEVSPYMAVINKKFQVGPRTYVEEVLANAVAYKVYKKYHKILPYKKEFKKIQKLGIPGI